MRLLNRDIICILALLPFTIITRLLLIANAPFIYHIDSYAYMWKAMDFASRGTIQFELGMPFVFFLGGFFKIFGSTVGVILISRFFMLLIDALLVISVYLFGLRISGWVLGFLAALLATFEPWFLSYSIVPHNDVFAVAMALMTLYFACEDNKSRYILSPIFFYFAVFTRAELYLVLIIPILIFYFCKSSKFGLTRGTITTIFAIFVYVLPSILVYQRTVLGRFGVVERFILFLKPELLMITLESSFCWYDQQYLNQAVFALTGVGMALGFLNTIAERISFGKRGKTFLIRYRKKRSIRDILISDKVMIALCLFASFVIYITILTTYGFGYVVTDGTLTIIPKLPERYLILPRLLMSYALAYPWSLIMQEVCVQIVHRGARIKLAGLLIFLMILSLFYTFHCVSMWQKASTYSNDASTALSARVEAAEWLSKRLEQDEIALVPLPEVFYVTNPELRDKLVDYLSLWDSAGVFIGQRGYNEDVLKVRTHFINFLKENRQIRYIVRDWVDPYATCLYKATVNDELMILLREVKEFPFTLSTGWSSKITIYERVQYTTLFAVELSSLPRKFSRLPRDIHVQFDSYGATIHKVGSRVGFYLPLEEGINSSKQNYLTMQTKLDVEDLELILVFYYDRNRDEVFSGYEIDYVKSATFYQTEQRWVAGEWYKVYQVIPKADDPVVQIGIILMGDRDGALTLSDLVVYTETTFEA